MPTFAQTVVDNFDDNSISPAWVNWGTTVQETNQQLRIQSNVGAGNYQGMDRAAAVDFDQTWWGVRVVAAGTQQSQLETVPCQGVVDEDNEDAFYWAIQGGVARCWTAIGGIYTQRGANLTYNSSTHVYFAVGIDADNNLSWAWSTDGVNFTIHATLPNPYGTTTAGFTFYAGRESSGGSSTQVIFDDFSSWIAAPAANPLTGTATLGPLTGTAAISREVHAAGAASLGTLAAAGALERTVHISGEATLGGLTAHGSVSVPGLFIGTADLGPLAAAGALHRTVHLTGNATFAFAAVGNVRVRPPAPSLLLVEVRDVTLARVGQIMREDLHLRWTQVHNGVGEWELRLRPSHPLAEAIQAPGAGLLVTGDGFTWSGPTLEPIEDAGTDDPGGMLTIRGVTDSVIIDDDLAWPDPSNEDITTQALANDERTGPAETLMRAYVSANIGPAAPPSRRSALAQLLTLAPDEGRGPTITKRPRFQVLSELLTECATPGLGWRVVQVGGALQLQVYEVADRTGTVRFDIFNGDLTAQTASIRFPDVTRVIVGGQGEGAARTLVARTSVASLAAESAWGRRRARFVDQRQTDELAELERAGDEELANGLQGSVRVSAVPADRVGKRYPRDWREGDQVAVVVFGQELPVIVAAAELVASPDGVRISAVLGDPAGFDPQAYTSRRQAVTERRLSALERST